MGGSGKWCKEDGYHEQDGVVRNTFKEDIKYTQQHIGLILTLPNSGTQPEPKPHKNDPFSYSRYTGHYLVNLTTIFNTREPSETQIKV